MNRNVLFLCMAAVFPVTTRCPADWQPANGRLMTRWAKEVSPENVLPEYPRPQMVRNEWKNLNGLWDYSIRPKNEPQPAGFDGKILVPFAVESSLSGVAKKVGQTNRLWYRRSFEVPADWTGQRILLHFGAVDWDSEIWVNDKKVGEHRGGYDPFDIDITDELQASGSQKLVVGVWDPTDTYTQPRGKQMSEPRGIWYTAVTGIWRTVWLEPVPKASIGSLSIVPNVDNHSLRAKVYSRGAAKGYTIKVVALDGDRPVAEAVGPADESIQLAIRDPKLWSPDSPFLYDLKVTLQSNEKTVDVVSSYFGMRKIAIGKDEHGFNRLYLNDEPLFQFGPLDQGWWPDGLYTAPTDEALQYDIQITKQLGFNMLRKHVKVEPARFYYHCDKLGMLVWQDMPNGNLPREKPNNLKIGPHDPDANRDPASAAQFEKELAALIDNYSHFPSIVMWVPFNEGWGQYDTKRISSWIEKYDPTRLVNATSGWTDRGVGDVRDVHEYPGPGIEPAGPYRAAVLGEFGGLGWAVEGHLWWNKRNWGYRSYSSREELGRNYQRIVGNLYGLLGHGLAAAIYTQTTDVEGEVNGLMTYDREVLKYNPAELSKLHARMYGPSPIARTLLPSSSLESQTWSYTFTKPQSQWNEPNFQGADWKRGKAPFQSGESQEFATGTLWQGKGKQIWLRRSFEIDEQPSNLWLEIFQNVTTASIYINGKPVANFEEPRATKRHYRHMDLSEQAGMLKPGKNVIAVHCTKKLGIRGIDLGLYVLEK